MLKVSIENTQEEIEYLKGNDGMKGLSYDGISTSPTNETKSATEQTALSNIEAIHYLERTIQKTKLEIDSIDRALEGLEQIERTVIIEKYINSKQWWQVASVVCYSEVWCRKLRTKAINKLIIGVYSDKEVSQ